MSNSGPAADSPLSQKVVKAVLDLPGSKSPANTALVCEQGANELARRVKAGEFRDRAEKLAQLYRIVLYARRRKLGGAGYKCRWLRAPDCTETCIKPSSRALNLAI